MSLPQFWSGANRKDLAERALVAKREQQAQFTQRCESAAKYHRDLNLLSSQYKNLEDNVSSKTPRVNKESRTEEELRAKSKEKHYQRQQQLKLLLAQENERYLAELKELSNDNDQKKDPWKVAKLKEQIETLRKDRLQNEELLQRSSRYKQHHMANIPYIKEHEEKLQEKEVLNAWNQQKKKMEEQVDKKSSENLLKRKELDNQHEQVSLDLDAAKIERLEMFSKWEDTIREQIIKIETNRTESDKLTFQAELVSEYEEAVESVSKNHQEVNLIQQKRIEKIIDFRPSKEKVRKMASEVIHHLDVDMKSLVLLEGLLDKKGEYLVSLNLDRIKAAKETIEKALAKENSLLSEMQVLFEEEVKKMWKDKKKTWDEVLALQKDMMNEVFESLRNQIKQKKKEYLLEQKDLLVDQQRYLQLLNEAKEKAKQDADSSWEKELYFKNRIDELESKLKKHGVSNGNKKS